MSIDSNRKRYIVEEMRRLRVGDVRPLVDIGAKDVTIPQWDISVQLQWKWKNGGCFGPSSSEAMNRRRGIPRDRRDSENTTLDRGCTGGWHLFLKCPACCRTCYLLLSPKLKRASWACRVCHRATYNSCNRPGRVNSPKGADYLYEKHKDAAIKIRRDLLGLKPLDAAAFQLRPAIAIKKPKGMSHERWEALKLLSAGHESLAQLANLDRMVGRFRTWGLSTDEKPAERARFIAFAEGLIQENRWALRAGARRRAGSPGSKLANSLISCSQEQDSQKRNLAENQ